MARLAVKVVPKSSRDAVEGFLAGAVKVRVTAPPERGRANAAVEALLAERLGVPRARVRIVAGHASARKTVEIEGLTEEEVRGRIGGVDA